jgi:hypothetical protein
METVKRTYPRALPHRSPDELAAQSDRLRDAMDELAVQSARLRRWIYSLAAALGIALAAGAALGIYWMSTRAGPPPLAAASVSPAPEMPAATVDRTEPPARSAKIDGLALSKKTQTPPDAAKAKPAGETIDTQHRAMFLETLGGLSAANLYQSYLSIGLLADGVENKSITVEAATSTLKIVTSCLGLVDRKLAKLDKAALEPDDQDSIEEIQAVAELLRLQSQAALAYWATGKAEQGADFEKTRKATWTALSKVLGLDAAP